MRRGKLERVCWEGDSKLDGGGVLRGLACRERTQTPAVKPFWRHAS